jgi:hypothetical protein
MDLRFVRPPMGRRRGRERGMRRGPNSKVDEGVKSHFSKGAKGGHPAASQSACRTGYSERRQPSQCVALAFFDFVVEFFATASRPLLFRTTVVADFLLRWPLSAAGSPLESRRPRIRSVYRLAILISASVRDLDTPRILAVSCAVAKRLSTLIARAIYHIIKHGWVAWNPTFRKARKVGHPP